MARLLRLCFLYCRLDKKPISSVGKRNIPFDVDITIYEETRLLMNHEGCSNSLSEECTAFHRDFGRVSKQYLRNIKPADYKCFHNKDGRNYTTRSRFNCFHTKKYDDYVAAYLDLEVKCKTNHNTSNVCI